jgi:hypothetical protein
MADADLSFDGPSDEEEGDKIENAFKNLTKSIAAVDLHGSEIRVERGASLVSSRSRKLADIEL